MLAEREEFGAKLVDAVVQRLGRDGRRRFGPKPPASGQTGDSKVKGELDVARKVIAVIVHQPVVRAILDCLGLGERAPPAPDQVVLDASDLRDEWPPEQAFDGPAPDEYP